MVTDDEPRIYRDLMRFKPDELTPNGWAVRAGVSRTVWSDMRRHGNPSRRTLEKLLSVAGSSVAAFEALRVGAGAPRPDAASGTLGEAARRGWATPPLPPLPLLRCELAGEWPNADSGIELIEIRRAEVVEALARPASLATDADAYALTVLGSSMWPRFRTGRRVAVAPRAPAAIGDDVLVRHPGRHGDGRGELALLKELVRRAGDRLELRQFNPDATFTLAMDEVESIEKVAGELI
jgi:hypothetical protein